MQDGLPHDERITQILNSLEGLQSAEPRPFLHTRLAARMERDRTDPWMRAWDFVSRPVVALSIICSLLLLNMYTVYQRAGHSADVSEESLSISSADYDGQYFSYYAINDEQP